MLGFYYLALELSCINCMLRFHSTVALSILEQLYAGLVVCTSTKSLRKTLEDGFEARLILQNICFFI